MNTQFNLSSRKIEGCVMTWPKKHFLKGSPPQLCPYPSQCPRPNQSLIPHIRAGLPSNISHSCYPYSIFNDHSTIINPYSLLGFSPWIGEIRFFQLTGDFAIL